MLAGMHAGGRRGDAEVVGAVKVEFAAVEIGMKPTFHAWEMPAGSTGPLVGDLVELVPLDQRTHVEYVVAGRRLLSGGDVLLCTVERRRR